MLRNHLFLTCSSLLTTLALATSCAPAVVVCATDDDCAAGETCVLGEEGEGLCSPVDKPDDDKDDDRPGDGNDSGPDPDPLPDAGPDENDAGPNDAGPNDDAGPNENDAGPDDDAGPPPDPARILSFTASDDAVTPGAEVALSWQTEGATGCTLDDGTTSVPGLPANASDHLVTLTAPTDFTLTCTNGAGGDDEASLRVELVVGIPSFDASRATLNEGQEVTLSWSTHGAASCDLRGPDLPGGYVVPAQELAAGAHTFAVLEGGIYTLSCTGIEGPVSRTLTLTRARFKTPPSVSPEAIGVSGHVTLAWELENATDDGCAILDDAGNVRVDDPTVAGYEVLVDRSQTLTVRCDGYDETAPLEAQVYVPVLITALAPANGAIDYDTSTELVVGLDPSVTSCTLNEAPVTFLVGTRIAVGPLTQSTPYTLVCVDEQGREAVASTLVQVRPTVPEVRTELSMGAVVLSWTVSENATSCTVAGAPNGGNVPVTAGEGAHEVTYGEGVVAYTVTCTSDVPGDASAPIQVFWGDIDNDEDLTPLSDVSFIMGSVVYDGTEVTAAQLQPLSSLAAVDGDVRVGPVIGLERLELPGLREVRGELTIEGIPELVEVELRALERVEGAFTVRSNSGLKELYVDALVFVGSDVWIENNAVLSSLDGFSCLEIVEGEAFFVDSTPAVSCAEIEAVYCGLAEDPRPVPHLDLSCPNIDHNCTTSSPLTCMH